MKFNLLLITANGDFNLLNNNPIVLIKTCKIKWLFIDYI